MTFAELIWVRAFFHLHLWLASLLSCWAELLLALWRRYFVLWLCAYWWCGVRIRPCGSHLLLENITWHPSCVLAYDLCRVGCMVGHKTVSIQQCAGVFNNCKLPFLETLFQHSRRVSPGCLVDCPPWL